VRREVMAPLIMSSREDLEHQLVTLFGEGWSIRTLCRHFGLGRNTVRRILRKHKARRDHGHDGKDRGATLPRASKLDPHIPRVRALLDQFPNITGERIFEELKADGYEGGISILRDRLRALRHLPKKDPVVRFETEPGAQGQMDWSPYTIRFTRTGKATVLCFSYILAFSRRQYIDFALHRDFHTLIRRHQDTFDFFGGAPAHCLYDGEKTVVLRFEAGRPVYNPAFIAFITHYECRPVAVRRARTKGQAERSLANINMLKLEQGYEATPNQWLEDMRTPTRLGDVESTVRLARWVGGRLTPWYSQGEFLWDMSQVGLRSAVLHAEADHPDPLLRAAIERLKADLPDKGKWSILVPLSPEVDGTWRGNALNKSGSMVVLSYDPAIGVTVTKKEQ
jgi:transposase